MAAKELQLTAREMFERIRRQRISTFDYLTRRTGGRVYGGLKLEESYV